MPTVEFLCLANSSKKGGRCVAGLRTDGQGWLRPVNPPPGGQLNWSQCLLNDRKEIMPLDVVRVSLTKKHEQPYQPENWFISDEPLQLVRRISPVEAAPILEPALVSGPDLLGNRSETISKSELEANPPSASLALIEPENLEWVIELHWKGYLRPRASFVLTGITYSLSITDPIWKDKLKSSLAEGTHSLKTTGINRRDRVLLTISLGSPLGSYCWKFVAGIIVIPTN
jgi:hypothetical protein